MTETIDIRIKRIPEGTFRKYTREVMSEHLLKNHPLLVEEVFDKSYFIDDLEDAAGFLADCFIDECLDLDTLETDAERTKRIPKPVSNGDLWDKISEEI